MIKTYSEMMKLSTYEERFDYLKLWNAPHVSPDDILYRKFLKTQEWIHFRQAMRDRDYLQDLGVEGMFILTKSILHHIDPITTEDILNHNIHKLLNPENVIITSIDTHNRIHYKPVDRVLATNERKPGDTTLW